MRDYLKRVEIRSDDQAIAFPGLDDADIKGREDCTHISLQIIGERTSMPLAKFRGAHGVEGNAKLYISNQITGRFPCARYPAVKDIDHDSVEIVMTDHSGKIYLRGRVQNLSLDDIMEKIVNEGEAVEWEFKAIDCYLFEGEEYSSPSETFTPSLSCSYQSHPQPRFITASRHLKKDTGGDKENCTPCQRTCQEGTIRAN